jgi:hypothetical protein
MSLVPRDVVENTIPILAVADVSASIRFYCDLLDFQCDWTGSASPLLIASVSRDGHAIMLQRRESVAPGWVWIGISGLAALWHKVRSSGKIAVIQRPTNQTFALEMKIQDPDGNILWFGTEPLKNVPFGDEPAEVEPWE